VKVLDQLMDWEQEYEKLRWEALKASSHRGHGLALFLTRGMTAWLEALMALRSRQLLRNPLQEPFDLPSVLRPDLTTLLANLVLSCIGREAHEHLQ
jgi:hypothetical protein